MLAGLHDGDKGDVTYSNGGNTVTVDQAVVSTAARTVTSQTTVDDMVKALETKELAFAQQFFTFYF